MSAAAATAVATAIAGLRPRLPVPRIRLACLQCHRTIASSAVLASGHNRWSKIRHEKGAADAKRNQMRSGFAKTLTLYSQLYGADLDSNPQLAATVTAAKKAGVPKATIEGAIARGQGRSTSGARLENMTYEIIVPPTVAIIVDLETESRARAMQDINQMVRRKGGTATSTKFFFSRRGRVVLGAAAEQGSNAAPKPPDVSADDVLEDAIEAGAEDVETDEDGNIVVWTPPFQTNAIIDAVAAKFKLATHSAETIWDANEETLAPVGNKDELNRLVELVAALRVYPDVRAIYANVTQGDAPEETWQQLVQDLDC